MFTVFCIAVYKSCMDSCHRERRESSWLQKRGRSSLYTSDSCRSYGVNTRHTKRYLGGESRHHPLENGLLGLCLVLFTFRTQRGRSTHGRGQQLPALRRSALPRLPPNAGGEVLASQIPVHLSSLVPSCVHLAWTPLIL